MRINDAVFGVILIVFALAAMAYTTTFPRLHGQSYGPDLFPIIICLGLLICGVMLVVQGYRTRATVPMATMGAWARERGTLTTLVALIASIIAYILFADAIGFVPMSIAILTLLMVRLGTSLGISLLIAVITTLVIHTLFAKLLLVPLPWGLLLPIAW